jgi:hypothetical protein
MGIRALLESVMVEQGGDSGQIGKNVDKFLAEGHVASRNHETFRFQLIEAGHAAMHRGYVPSKEDIGVLLSITESLIESIYVHAWKVKNMKEIPAREGKKTGKKQ